MAGSSILCVIAYLMIALLPYPVLNLVGCGLCGLSVGIMWPGTFSKASAAMPFGGTAMFALLALAGDLGCSGGPLLREWWHARPGMICREEFSVRCCFRRCCLS